MNRKLYDELLIAIKAKDQKSIEKWLKKNPCDLNGVTPNYKATPLCYAVRCGNLEIVQLLVEKGADVNYAIPSALTPLMEATKLNDKKLQILIFLLEKSADLDQSVSNDKKTALSVAVQEQNIPTIQYLLEKGANTEIGMPDPSFGFAGKNLYTPLYQAVSDGNRAVIETLLKAGADANIAVAKEQWSQNLLVVAIKRQCKWLAELLVKYGASMDSSYLSSGQRSSILYLLSRNIHSDLQSIEQTPDAIENLDLRGLPIKALPDISNLKNLKRLLLGQNAFKKINCKDLKINTLQYLHCQYALLNDFNDEDIENCCPNLKVIDLRGNKIKKAQLTSLRTKLPNCIVVENDSEWEKEQGRAKAYFL